MNERSVNPIAKVPAKEPVTARENASSVSDRPRKQVRNETDLAKNMSNISIHFNVDDETNKLIVVVTDRQTGRVVRTIPASELDKLQAGDLLKLSA